MEVNISLLVVPKGNLFTFLKIKGYLYSCLVVCTTKTKFFVAASDASSS
jgi:hypothetical protein